MVLIAELEHASQDKTITFANYTEGPDRFDEWYSLVRKKYPNIFYVDCINNRLTSLTIPDNIIINCSRNKLKFIDCPEVKELYCSNNKLESLYCPIANRIYCPRNKIKSLYCPMASDIDCSGNKLEYLDTPKAFIMKCDGNYLRHIIAPEVQALYCYNNPDLELIEAPKIVELKYDIGAIIPLDLRDPDIYDRNNNKLDYEEIGRRITQRKIKRAFKYL